MKNKYIIDDSVIDNTKLADLITEYKNLFRKHSRIMVHSANPLPIILSLHLCEDLNLSLYLCHSFFSVAEVEEYIEKYDIDLFISADEKLPLKYRELKHCANIDQEASIHIFTTGTTGKPKLAKHSWDSISRAARHVSEWLRRKNWLMAYSFTGYAGLQVFFSSSKSNGSLVFVNQGDFTKIARAIVKRDVNIISATPTFWRMLINSWPSYLPKPHLEQISLGGEIVTQDIIDMCEEFFNPSRLTHIYASTEAGSAIAVSDKNAGFPVSFLDPERKIKLRVNDNILEINSPARMKCYVGIDQLPGNGNWITTGDVVETRGERVYFVGRNDGRINVGGSKVLPEEVEDALLRLEEVKDCVAYQRKNPIVGSILAADIIIQPNIEISIKKIKDRLKVFLADYKIPQLYRITDSLRISENGKKIRN